MFGEREEIRTVGAWVDWGGRGGGENCGLTTVKRCFFAVSWMEVRFEEFLNSILTPPM